MERKFWRKDGIVEIKTVLTNALFRLYYENGFCVIQSVFSHDECEQILELCKSKAEKDFRPLININEEIRKIRNFICDERIRETVEFLHNAHMGYLGSQVLFKEAGSVFANPGWNTHQDNAYIEAPYGTYVSVIIPLRDSDRENGGMFIYPKSHVEPLLPYEFHASDDSNSDSGYLIKDVPSRYVKTDLCMTQGSLYIQHGNLLHGSYPNTSKTRSRPHIGIQCIVEGVSFNKGGKGQRKFTPFHRQMPPIIT